MPPQYLVRVEQRVERVVTVEAWSAAEAKAMAERGEGGWIDRGKGETVGIEALDVNRAEDEPDAMQAWRDRQEAM